MLGLKHGDARNVDVQDQEARIWEDADRVLTVFTTVGHYTDVWRSRMSLFAILLHPTPTHSLMLLTNYVLSTHYVPGTVLEAGDTVLMRYGPYEIQ